MARKKALLSGTNKIIVVGIIIAGITGLLLGPLFIEDFPINILGVDVLPFEQLRGDFDVTQNNQLIIDENQILVLFGSCLDGSIPTPVPGQANTFECPNGDMYMINCEDTNFCTDPFDPDARFINGTGNRDTEEEIQKMINDNNMNLMETPEDKPMNMTETSDDPPIVQACDQLGIACGSEVLEVEAVITKIDFNGTQFVVTETFGVPQLSFFIEDTTDISFRDGFIELELFLKSEPNRLLEITDGKFDVVIGGQNLFQTPIRLQANGITSDQGLLQIDFIPPNNIPSSKYIFDFEQNIALFPDNMIPELTTVIPFEMNLNKLDITRNNIDTFSLINQTIFSMDIVRDEIKILLQNEVTGEFDRVFPTDSRFIIHSKEYCVPVQTCATISTSNDPTIACVDFRGNQVGFGCGGTIPAPNIGRVEVFDSSGELFGFDNGGVGDFAVEIFVTRNANYSMTLAFPVHQIDLLEYGTAQKNIIYECWQEGFPTYANVYREKTQWYTFQGHITTGSRYVIVTSITVGGQVCNIP